MKISKEFKVGLLAIISIAILYMGFNYLKGINLLKSTNNYYALYENIDGLTVSNPVIINGLSVGRVNNIVILQQMGNLVAVEVAIDVSIKLAEGTIAKLVNTDFLGSKAIELILNDGPEYLIDGDTLKSEIDPGITEFLKQSAGPVADNIGTTISRINAILESFQGNSVKINNTLANLEMTTASFRRGYPEMQEKIIILLENLNNNSKELSTTLNELQPVLRNFSHITDSVKAMELAATFQKTRLMLDNLNTSLNALNEGQGTMGKLMKDDSLYVYLSYTARDLDKLLVDLQANPERYVQFSMFGKKDKSEKKKKKQAKKEAAISEENP